MKYLTFLFWCATICAQAQNVTQHGPSDTYYAVDLEFGRNNRAFLSTNGGLYFSDNKGSSWQKVKQTFNSIYFEPTISKNKNGDIYACDYQGAIYYTKDNGVTWDFYSPLYTADDRWIKAFGVYGDTIFIGTPLGLKYISGSERYPVIKEIETLKGKDITAVHVKSKRVIVGTKDHGIFISDNLGIDWSNIMDGFPPDFHVTGIEVSDGKIFISTYWNGIYLSVDDGAQWTQINSGFNTLHVADFYRDGETLYAATDSYENVYKCTIGDYNWQLIDSGIENTYATTAIVASGNDVILGTWGGIFISSNAGADWKLSMDGVYDAGTFKSMYAAPDGSIVAIASHMGIYHKKPTETMFQRFIRANDNFGRGALKDNSVPVITSSAIKFIDLHSKAVVEEVPVPNVPFADELVTRGFVYFLSTLQNGVYRQTGPLTWEPYSQGLVSLEIKQLTSFEDQLYAATPAGLFIRSIDDDQWRKIDIDVSNPGIETFIIHEDVMVASSLFHTFISRDDGETWTEVQDLYNVMITAMLYHDGVIYLAGNSELWFSKDAGITWRSFALPQSYYLESFLVAGDRLYIATVENGILSIPTTFTDIITHIAPEGTASLTVSPNPGTGIFTLHTSGEPVAPETFQVRDIVGRLVNARIEKIDERDNRLNLTDCPAGIYFLLKGDDKERSVIRIVKK